MFHKWMLFCAIFALIAMGCESQDTIISDGAPASSNISTSDEAVFERQLEAEIVSEAEDLTLSPESYHTINGPTVITEPGIYRVVDDFSVSAGDGIVIQSNHVLLLLGHHTITGPGNKEGRGIVMDNVRNVLVVGGQLETFGIGIFMEGTSVSAVKSVDVLGGDEFADPPNGVAPQIGILLLNSYRNAVIWNNFDQINLGIFVRGEGSFRNNILFNDVRAGQFGLLGVCYNPAPNAGDAGPRNDRVNRNKFIRFGTGISASAGSVDNRFQGNRIDYFNADYVDLNGSNIFRRNVTNQITP